MRQYSKRDIEEIYRLLMKSAHANVEVGKLSKAVRDVESAAKFAYGFNLFYTDKEAEDILRNLSDAVIPKLSFHSAGDDRCVLIDSFCLDNRGLVQQYLRAMQQYDMQILYICTASTTSFGKDILKELRANEKVQILLLSDGRHDVIEKAKIIAEAIASFSPSRIFLHLEPWDCVPLMACHALKGATKYNINLTDHAYWLGASFIDYNLEFRPYGMTVSLEQRHLEQSQLLPMPYYPIEPVSKEFCGLPSLPPDAFVVLTGGALYKMMGKNGIFFKLMDAVLSLSPRVYILVAGFEADNHFNECCHAMKNANRVVQIGVRSDIDAVFDYCDVFLSTYPMIGGLMLQYAAKHGKPIIAYHDRDDVMNLPEEILNNYQDHFRSYSSIDDMTAYAERLMNDQSFLRSEGLVLQKGMMTEDLFAKALFKTISSLRPQWNWTKDVIDYDAFFERYLELENTNGFAVTKTLVKQQGVSLFFKMPGFRKQMLQAMIGYMNETPIKELIVWLMPQYLKRKILSN